MRRRLLLVVAAYVSIVLVVVGVGWLITHTFAGPVSAVDDGVARWFADQRTPDLDSVAEAGTFLGETWVGLIVIAVVALASGLWDRALRGPLVAVLASAGAGGIYWVASHAVPRDRPPVEILDPGLVPTHSFPSGHVGTAVAAYGAAALLLAVRIRAAGLRGAATVVLLAAPVVVAVSRLYQGAHHLTDVVTSLAYGTVWLAVLLAVRHHEPAI